MSQTREDIVGVPTHIRSSTAVALRRVLRSFAREDVFISYARKQSQYVDALAALLDRRGFTYDYDRLSCEPGTAVTDDVLERAASASMLLIICSSDSAASQHVLKEIEAVRAAKKQLILVGSRAAYEFAVWRYLVPGLPVIEDEVTGNPSSESVEQIAKAFKYPRRSVRLRRFFWTTIIIGLITAVTGSVWLSAAQAKLAAARSDTRIQSARAARQRRMAEHYERLATARRLAQQAVDIGNMPNGSPSAALRLALQSLHAAPTPEALSAVATISALVPRHVAVHPARNSLEVAITSRGDIYAIADELGLTIFSADGSSLWRFPARVSNVAFAPDDHVLAFIVEHEQYAFSYYVLRMEDVGRVGSRAKARLLLDLPPTEYSRVATSLRFSAHGDFLIASLFMWPTSYIIDVHSGAVASIAGRNVLAADRTWYISAVAVRLPGTKSLHADHLFFTNRATGKETEITTDGSVMSATLLGARAVTYVIGSDAASNRVAHTFSTWSSSEGRWNTESAYRTSDDVTDYVLSRDASALLLVSSESSVDQTTRLWTWTWASRTNSPSVVVHNLQKALLSSDGSVVVALCNDAVHVFDAQTASELQRVERSGTGDVAIAAKASRIVATDGEHATLWDTGETVALLHPCGDAQIDAISGDGRLVGGFTRNESVVCDVATRVPVWRRTVTKAQPRFILSDRYVGSGSFRYVELSDIRARTRFPVPEMRYVAAIAVSPNEKWLAIAAQDGVTFAHPAVTIMDLTTRQLVRTVAIPKFVRSLVIANNGAFIAAAEDDRVWVYSIANQRFVYERNGPGVSAISPDGAAIAVGSCSDVVLLDPASGRVRQRIDAQQSVERIVFSPSSKLLIALTRDAAHAGTFNVFDVTTGAAVGQIYPPGRLRTFAVPEDGTIRVVDFHGIIRDLHWRERDAEAIAEAAISSVPARVDAPAPK